jgi:hypothetical protein
VKSFQVKNKQNSNFFDGYGLPPEKQLMEKAMASRRLQDNKELMK